MLGAIALRHVTFSYPQSPRPVLRDLSLDIGAGEFVALIGYSGVGKTTLCSLIPRFYEATSGQVLIDGVDVKDIALASLRRNIGVVQQDVYLFAGTVADNLGYGRPGASRAEIVEAARKAYAHDFIMALPAGYDTDIGQRGVKLSGGQKQRLTIARVFLKDPPILIFDEATSALDHDSERAVQAALHELAADRTTLVIAHRLSTVRHADRIVVLTEAGVGEQGSHDALIAAGGAYAALFNNQGRASDGAGHGQFGSGVEVRGNSDLGGFSYMRMILFAGPLAGAAFLSLSSAALAAPADGPSRRFEARDLFALEEAQDPQIRPDGLAVAYVRSSEDIMADNARRSIWLVDVGAGVQTPLVAGPDAAFEPRWSPDGGRLAYVSTAGGKPQLYIRWMASGATARVADLPQAPGNLAWSPDGRTIAFSMLTEDDPPKLGAPVAKPEGAKWADPLVVIDAVTYRADGEGYLKPGFSHVYVVSADGGAPRQLTFGAFNERGELSWTPDGRSLIISANRTKDWALQPQESDLFQLSVADGALTQLSPFRSQPGPARYRRRATRSPTSASMSGIAATRTSSCT